MYNLYSCFAFFESPFLIYTAQVFLENPVCSMHIRSQVYLLQHYSGRFLKQNTKSSRSCIALRKLRVMIMLIGVRDLVDMAVQQMIIYQLHNVIIIIII